MDTRTAFITLVILSIIGYSAAIFDLLDLFDFVKCECGSKNMVIQSRIVGGTETGVNEFPMMAGLVDDKTRIIYCGATIISERYVITAAHCVETRTSKEIGVIVGEHDATTGRETNTTVLFRVLNFMIHPKYEDNVMLNDIAVVQIIGLITYSTHVGSVCLPFKQRDNLFDGAIVTALGWGLLKFGGNKATTLQKVDLDVINPTSCKDIFESADDSIMCTYTPNQDTCQEDSGGPVLWNDPNMYIKAGFGRDHFFVYWLRGGRALCKHKGGSLRGLDSRSHTWYSLL